MVDTPDPTVKCENCRKYYSERFCQDCDLFVCSWCNLSLHKSIGKRNHERPRLYGTDYFTTIEARRDHWKASSIDTKPLKSSCELLVPVSLAECWQRFGAWNGQFMANKAAKRRVRVQLAEDGVRRWIHWDDHDHQTNSLHSVESGEAGQTPLYMGSNSLMDLRTLLASESDHHNQPQPNAAPSAATSQIPNTLTEVLLEVNDNENYYRFSRIQDTTQELAYTDHEGVWRFSDASDEVNGENEDDRDDDDEEDETGRRSGSHSHSKAVWTRLEWLSEARAINDSKEDIERGFRALEKIHLSFANMVRHHVIGAKEPVIGRS